MTNFHALAAIGWGPFFLQQLSLSEWEDCIPVRVIEQHKSLLTVATESEQHSLPINSNMPTIVVGDWLLLDKSMQFTRALDRKTCFRRKSAGSESAWQLIAANVDTAFILCSLNDDFNLSRVERYLALAHEAQVEPVIVLTKSDLVEEPESWTNQIHKMDPLLSVVAVNALSHDSVAALNDWLGESKTTVVLGSSGVGKSTLSNTLLGESKQMTGGIREDDAKGRHTTTRRSILAIPGGGMILDTPGMRELQLADCQDGIASTFADVERFATQCKFSDCRHNGEPGCAVIEAMTHGTLDERRVNNYRKLLKEEAINTASIAEKRARDKALGKFYKTTLTEAYKIKGRY